MNYARCCHPIPGDDIIGFLSSGRGVIIHRTICPNVADFRKHPTKWIPVAWQRSVKGEFQSEIQVRTMNRVGLLAEVAGRISATQSNIDHVTVESDGDASTLLFRLKVRDRRHLAQVIRSIRTNPDGLGARFMAKRQPIATTAAPAAIGTYSQAVRAGNTVYLSGQIPLDPDTMEVVNSSVEAQIRRVFDNLAAVAAAAGGSLDDIVKLTVYLTDLGNFATVNEIMATYFSEPYPARAAIGIASLPRGAAVEIDAILVL